MTAVPTSRPEGVRAAPERLVYRPMSAVDLDEVVVIESLAGPEPWSRSLLAAELDLPPDANHWLVAERKATGSVIGFAGIMVVADEAHVLNVAVHPDHRQRGVGRQLMIRILDAGRDRGAVATTLEVRSTNTSAIDLYSSLGFRPTGRRRRYYRDGTDAVIMWCRRSNGARP